MDPKGKGRADGMGGFVYDPIENSEPEEERIYSKHIRLEYTPPVELPAPFPRTLFVDGAFRSSGVMQHLLLSFD